MRLRAGLAMLAALVSLSVPAATVAQRGRHAASAQRDWTEVAVRTPEGGFRIGNPAARVKLVEYGSITCPHCAAFSVEGAAALRQRYVRSGRVSWEYRPYMIFPTDPGIFLLLGCLGPGRFFPASEQLYASQRVWAGRLQNLTAEQAERLQGLPPARQAAALVRATGLDTFFRQHGMSEAQINACLNNRAALVRLADVTGRGGSELGVEGTPTFFINGRSQNVGSWIQLEPLLRDAVGGRI